MLLTVMKHAGHWDFLDQMFKVKGPTFEKLVTGFLSVVCTPLYDALVGKNRAKWTYKQCVRDKTLFKNFKYA